MRVGFTHVESGLTTRKGLLEDFVIAEDDQKFVKAHAEIDGDTVVVWADEVAHPNGGGVSALRRRRCGPRISSLTPPTAVPLI